MRRLKGRVVPDPKPTITIQDDYRYEDYGPGVKQLVKEINPLFPFEAKTEKQKRATAKRRKRHRSHIRNVLRNTAIIISALAAPMLFVIFADILVFWPRAFWGAFAAAVGWPALVIWENMRD